MKYLFVEISWRHFAYTPPGIWEKSLRSGAGYDDKLHFRIPDRCEYMSLRAKLHNPAAPLIFYEIIPPALADDDELNDRLKLVAEVAGLVDVINIPEIREEVARGPRSTKLRARMEPREFARAIRDKYQLETVVNRVTVHDHAEIQTAWLQECAAKFGVQDLILVGGESANFTYAGPTVPQTARMARAANPGFSLGGITIPSRKSEAERVLAKLDAGIEFFTTQVLLESAHTIALLQALEGVKTRLILSFTPLSHPRDLAFLEWLGVSIPQNVAERFSHGDEPEQAVKRSIALAKVILEEVCEFVTPRSPAIGIQVERITKRNSAAALEMLKQLADFYPALLKRKMGSLEAAPAT